MRVIMSMGERRHIKLMIHSCRNDIFEITSATYELFQGDTKEDVGGCNIIDHMIDTVISPKNRGDYFLKVTYLIADEVLIDTVEVKVL